MTRDISAESRACVSVMPWNRVTAWPGKPGARAYAISIEQALTRPYRTDAHLVQYCSPNERRLALAALDEGVEVTASVVLFDIDCQEVHGTPEPAPEAWRAELREKAAELASVHPNPYVYFTRGGARIVYQQAEPAVLRSREDASAWSRDYLVALAYLERRFGIAGDVACRDWVRLFRCPHATREGGNGRPENWGEIGSAGCIGHLHLAATEADVQSAMARCPKAFRAGRVLDFPTTVMTSDGCGLLYHALRARGAVLGTRGREHIVRCPREQRHTSGRTGDGSTLLYPPANGHEIGAIACLHAHCSGLSVRDWLLEFSPHEIEAARYAAGMRRSS
jgi:hypothetical protein